MDYSNIAESTIPFTQGGTAPSCAIVRFSAEASTESSRLTLRALLDGQTVAQPGPVYLQSGDAFFAADRSFIFVFPKVAPGKHTLVMQMSTTTDENTVSIFSHTTTLAHR